MSGDCYLEGEEVWGWQFGVRVGVLFGGVDGGGGGGVMVVVVGEGRSSISSHTMLTYGAT